MMSISHLLETFEEINPEDVLGQSADDQRTDHELAVFERGYKAGWDDCTAAAEQSGAALSEAFAQNLNDLSFTYHEAYSALVRSIEPLVRQLVETTLPDLASDSLGQKLGAEVTALARSHAGTQLLVSCHPSRRNMVQSALPDGLSLSVSVVPDDRLTTDQITLKFSEVEREIDVAHFATQARSLIHNYFESIKGEPLNG
ncbi:hypothetical protein [Lentibacter sp.]|uniref:hypothetical protein n=1 Tax=Lentibacter sp. TaxID=2024994 RepID=UPI003F69ADA5